MKTATEKEIKAQPEAWEKTIGHFNEDEKNTRQLLEALSDRESFFVGCGTSYYLALSAAAAWTRITGRRARAVTASDVLLHPGSVFPRKEKPAGIVISRSGTTTEAIWAAKYLREKLEAETVAVTCNPESQLAGVCHRKLVAEAAEKSVVMTKSFTSMLLLLECLAASESDDDELMGELTSLASRARELIPNIDGHAREIARLDALDHFVFLGQGPFYGLACESMLKTKEMSLSASEAFHSLEFRHGPISTITEESLVVLLMSNTAREQELKVLKDVQRLGATTMVIGDDLKGATTADFAFELESGLSDVARLPLYMPITQLLAYHRAQHKGINPDNPKNLTQVVVLE
jgi:glucosamine--fructose-6-phosphate aminotransferase (isomerizing)